MHAASRAAAAAAPVAAGLLALTCVETPSRRRACCDVQPLGRAPEPPVDGAELRAVHVVFRHGARTPLTPKYWEGTRWDVCGEAFAKAPLTVRDHDTGEAQPECIDGDKLTHYDGGCTRGELTKLGQVQALELGQWLRTRYVQHGALLPPTYDPAAVAARTTNYRRTRATLHGVLTGLFPEQPSAFVATTGQQHNDVLLPQVNRCPALATLLLSIRTRVKQYAVSDSGVLADDARIRRVLRLDPDDEAHRVSWTELHDALTSMRSHGKPIPRGLTAGELDVIDMRATEKLVGILVEHPEILALSMGPLLHTIDSQLAAAAHGAAAAEPRLRLWCGHDTTIMPIMRALDIELARWPPYCSNVVIELWEAPAKRGAPQHYVRVLFNGRHVAPAGRSAAEPLPLAEFSAKMLCRFALDPSHFELRCAAPAESPSAAVDTSSI